MHNSITLEISPKQFTNLIERLPLEDKLRLVRRLEKETFTGRIDTAVQRMRTRIKKADISTKDIERICQDVKREYDEKHRSH